ncbi:MAG: 4Fe-4S binding protein [Muribaculaceae bacterium]|nr:4Fe-4S binding protein [Muribaculaceae bacterium]
MNNSPKHPIFSSRRCTACWKCVEACPQQAIKKVSFLWHKHAIPTYRNCIGCNVCVKACLHGCFRRND